jgi:hypothetical protein
MGPSCCRMGRRSYSPAISTPRVHSHTPEIYTRLVPAAFAGSRYCRRSFCPTIRTSEDSMQHPTVTRLAIATDIAVLTVDAATGAQQAIFPFGHVDFPRFTPDSRTVLMSVHPFTGHEWFPFLVRSAGRRRRRGQAGAGSHRWPPSSLQRWDHRIHQSRSGERHHHYRRAP